MIEKPVVWKPVKVWRLGKDGLEETTAKIGEKILGAEVIYDPKFQLETKNYSAECDVCLVQEQGYACDRITNAPGPYEFEGGCMDCRYLCRQPPVHIGVRNYCQRHIHILNQKIGVTNVKSQ